MLVGQIQARIGDQSIKTRLYRNAKLTGKFGSALLNLRRQMKNGGQTVANQISRMREMGDAGNPWITDEPCAAPHRFGEDLQAVVATLGDMQKILDDAAAFAQIGGDK